MYHIPVFRIIIEQNPSTEYPEIPEHNFANGNAMAMLRMLEIPEDYSGSISAIELKNRINAVQKENMEKEAIDPGYIQNHDNSNPISGEPEIDPADAWKQESLTRR